MLTYPAPQFRKRRGRLVRNAPPPPLVLVGGVYVAGPYRLVLTFDRAVDVAAYDGAAILVNDPTYNDELMDGQGGATLTAPETVEITLVGIAGGSGGQVLLNAAATNGIVAADDGAAWAGVTDFELTVP